VSEQALAIDVRVQGDMASGYSAKLWVKGAQGQQERFLDHPDCDKLTEAAALLVAIAIDPERVKSRQQGEPEAEPRPGEAVVPAQAEAGAPHTAGLALPAVEPSAVPNRVTDSRPAPSSRAGSARMSLVLVGLTSSGLLPSAAPGVGSELAVRLGPFEAALGGRYWISRSAAVPDAQGAAVDLSLVTAGLRLCGVPAFGDWALPLCARADLGNMQGAGQDVNNARTRDALFAAVGGSIALSYTRHRLVPLAGLDLTWAASRPRFGVLRAGQEVQAFRPDAWGLGGFVGLAYRL